jgi:hypothetical protein
VIHQRGQKRDVVRKAVDIERVECVGCVLIEATRDVAWVLSLAIIGSQWIEISPPSCKPLSL